MTGLKKHVLTLVVLCTCFSWNLNEVEGSVDDDEDDFCLNGGTFGTGENFDCVCPPGFFGRICREVTCDGDPCENGATCSVVVKDSESILNCQCPTGFSGRLCEKDACDPNPCGPDGECKTRDNGSKYTCVCHFGITGSHCEINVCSPNPCQHGGTCTRSQQEEGIYSCQCLPFFSGSNCEQDPCDPNPCKNGGTCTRLQSGYSCQCPPSFSGDNCEGKSTFLTGGSNENEGLVEMWHGDAWVTVCTASPDNCVASCSHWTEAEAIVACRQLSLPFGEPEIVNDTRFGKKSSKGSNDKMLSVACRGSEANLGECTINNVNPSCLIPVGVVCKNPKVRLAGSTYNWQGRVEVFYRGVWGTVCDKDGKWGKKEAQVVCRSLDFGASNDPKAVSGSISVERWGKGEGKIWRSFFSCTGTEKSLWECPYVKEGVMSADNCNHERDAGVICENK